jgi:hypothetical protein
MSIQFQDETNQYFIDLVDHLYQHGGDFDHHVVEARNAASRADIGEEDMKHLILSRWRQLVEHALDDGQLSQSEEENLIGIMNSFGLKELGANSDELYQRLFKLSRLRRLTTGEDLTGLKVDVPVPFKMGRGEALLWVTPNVKLHEVVVERSIKGGSLGASFRIAKGVYIRPSAFQARPVQSETMKITDLGVVFLTNKNLAFTGSKRNMKLRFTSLAKISPFSDGLELQKGGSTARPFFLEGLDGWFHYNVIQAS